MFPRGEEIHMLQGIKRTPETIEISGVSVRETGLEELGKRPYRTLSSPFVKKLIPIVPINKSIGSFTMNSVDIYFL